MRHALVVAAIMAIGLTGCSKKEEPPPAPPPAEAPAATPEPAPMPAPDAASGTAAPSTEEEKK